VNAHNIDIRRATELDQTAIRGLVLGERLNPSGLSWANFLVAAAENDVVGTVQMRKHADGSRELGSLVVSQAFRDQGVAARLVEAILAGEPNPVWVIAPEDAVGRYLRWGFRQIDPASAPVKVRRNHRIGSFVRLLSLVTRHPVPPLVILERLPR
jgi:N-acetylglutamate synthase-like GNAT family acetyltransferase